MSLSDAFRRFFCSDRLLAYLIPVRCICGWRPLIRPVRLARLTLRVSPPAQSQTMPRRVEMIREVGKHAKEQRARDA
eukprot:527109-Pyramimonas_sp.AAC.1